MRRSIAVLAIVVLSIIVLSSPAFAQRDPFDPVIDPNAATTSTGTTAGTGTSDTVFDRQAPGSVGSEGIANTGADVSPFLVIAFTLLSLGGLALAWARLHRPQPHRI